MKKIARACMPFRFYETALIGGQMNLPFGIREWLQKIEIVSEEVQGKTLPGKLSWDNFE
jgi:hypothetical protein